MLLWSLPLEDSITTCKLQISSFDILSYCTLNPTLPVINKLNFALFKNVCMYVCLFVCFNINNNAKWHPNIISLKCDYQLKGFFKEDSFNVENSWAS